MFGSIGGAEIVLVVVIALILFGPRRLPQIGRTVGRALSELRRATTDFRVSLEREVNVDEIKQARDEVSKTVREAKHLADLRRPPAGRPDASSDATAGPDERPVAAKSDAPATNGDGTPGST